MAKKQTYEQTNNYSEIGVYTQSGVGDSASLGSPLAGKQDGVTSGISYERISISRRSRIIGTPVETGVQYFDNKVLEPKTITVTGYINVLEPEIVMQALREAYENRTYSFYCVVSKGITEAGESLYKNLMLQDYSTEEDPEHWDLDRVTLTFLEIIVQQSKDQDSEPQNADDGKTVDIGDSTPAVPTQSDSSKRASQMERLGLLQ